MPEKYDELLQSIAELTETVKEHKGDQATIDVDKLAAEINGIIEQQVEAKLEQAEKDRPVRKGELIGPEGFAEPSTGVVQSGKFAGRKLMDVQFAGAFLKQAAQIDSKGVKPISADMEKLLTSDGSGTGDELVPTGMAASLWEDAFLASRVVGNLGVVAMPTDPWDWPLQFGAITWRKGTQGEATGSQDPATAKSTFTSTEQVADLAWTYNLDEDSVVAVMPNLRKELSRSAQEQMDAFTLNADATATSTGNINLDDSTPATDAYYLSEGQDGIRHYYLVDVTGQSTDITSTLEDAEWRAGIARLGKYGVNPNDVMAITNAKTYLISLMGMTNVRTLDKYGPGATILTGELARVDGIPIIVSESMPLAEDDGKVSATGSNNDEGQIALVNRQMWNVGFRRQMLIEVDRDIRKRQYIMVVSFRIAVGARNRTGTHTAGIHGITYS